MVFSSRRASRAVLSLWLSAACFLVVFEGFAQSLLVAPAQDGTSSPRRPSPRQRMCVRCVLRVRTPREDRSPLRARLRRLALRALALGINYAQARHGLAVVEVGRRSRSEGGAPAAARRLDGAAPRIRILTTVARRVPGREKRAMTRNTSSALAQTEGAARRTTEKRAHPRSRRSCSSPLASDELAERRARERDREMPKFPLL